MDTLTARKTCITKKAKKVGFTEAAINTMLLVLNLDERAIKDMSLRTFQDLLLYVNKVNAHKFNVF